MSKEQINKIIDTKDPHSSRKGSSTSYFGFIFELFMESRIHPFYGQTIINKLTHTKYQSIPLAKISTASNTLTIVHDVPDYLEVETLEENKGLKLKKIPQYDGFLVNLTPYKDVNAFLQAQLSARNRKKLRAKERKIKESHAISYTFYYGHIEKEQYDYLFDRFYELLEKRFDEKKMYNKNLTQWQYYHKLVYPLILDKKAFLFVIYDGDKPITLSMNFIKEDLVFSFIQTYDIDYSIYNMGDISIVKRLEWCKANNIAILDLSMGQTDYKIKWCNHRYTLRHHLFYDPKSIKNSIKVFLLIQKLNLKQYLRDKDIIGKWFQYDKFFYKSRKKKLDDYDWKDTNIEK